jgi:glycosyltransferase involved in cell wall biosynthesis
MDLAEAQAQMGWDVAVASLGNAEYAALLRRTGVATWDIPGDSILRWLMPLRSILRRTSPDVMHSHGYRADMVATALKAGSNRPAAAVMSLHGFIRTGMRMRALTALNELCLRRADAVIATSQKEAVRLSRWLPTVTFIPNGVSKQRSAARDYLTDHLDLHAPIRVGFVGRLSPEKRPDLFVEMASLLAAWSGDIGFVLIGGGPQEHAIRKSIMDRGLANRVRLAGLRQDVAELLCGLDVLVCPSDTEGTPRAIVEAMMARVPVVATRVGGVPDLVVDQVSGVLVAPGSASELARAVRALIESPEVSASITAAAFVRASSSFTAEAMSERTTQVYLKALAATHQLGRAI